ncbi:MAG TPA: glycosyltransferase family 2 protein [Gemmataceae bacterium]
MSVVVPLFNEEENLAALHGRLTAVLEKLGRPYEIVFIDDGSRDSTPELIDAAHQTDPHLSVVHLSRNFGHQPAVSAGLEHARGRAVVVMDGDLQDPPELLPEMVARWRAGADVAYAVRRKRKEHSLKRACYYAFYRLLGAISDLHIPLDSGDFCLMDRKVVDALNDLPERMRFVRGLRSFVGFRQVGVEYERSAREAGEPKYTFRKLVGLAADGLISFSGYPLRLVTQLGLATVAVTAAIGAWVVVDALANQTAPRGWASTMVVVLFMGSVQLISLGIVGEYIRLIFLETKRRPTYIARDYLPARRFHPRAAAEVRDGAVAEGGET